MRILALDTETTGKIPTKADVVQLAAVLVDQDLNEIVTLNKIVFPTYWTIPPDAARIHGITQDVAEAEGLSLPDVMAAFVGLASAADRFVIHNAPYDTKVITRALATAKIDVDPFAGKEVRCTMLAAKPVLKLPYRNGTPSDPYKQPRLEECYRYFFDEQLDGAHDALVDIRATLRVYGALCSHYGLAP